MSCQQANWPYNELITASVTSIQSCSYTPTHQNTQFKIPSILKSKPRQPRFTESTTVISPIETGGFSKPSGTDSFREACMTSQPQPTEVGLTFIKDDHLPCESVSVAKPFQTIFKKAVEAHDIPKNEGPNPLSPTFREEQKLQQCENLTDNEQAKDLKVKIRVRMAKFFLRGISFGCSLIVLTMVSISFSIFNATKNLPPRNHLPAWASGTKTWPQTFILVIACASLLLCLIIFWNYFRGGHRKAEKVAIYYTLLAVTLFFFSLIMWGIAAGILQGSRSIGQNKDLWGWSCVENKRRQLFSDKINYALVCRMQNWVLVCCIIEIVLESITILLYAAVFYRYYTKQRLRKSMHIRDQARSDLYLARRRTQSVLMSPNIESQLQETKEKHLPLEIDQTCLSTLVEKRPNIAISAKPFSLQSPPRKASFTTHKTPSKSCPIEQTAQAVNTTSSGPIYEKVPIPSAYSASPFQQSHQKS
ncbi:hypothetical protein OnM2_044017 [Erysiphe neolycopersici]|uniref:Hyphal anastamosis-8 protein n=1 Tax=Erysiphe neolycopersici TaxID=212602 RepID=A0A420HUK8_9PEZI|nr:hypothetical protein OnM2_044017 [Erysiphe neolycopersici]